MNEFAPVSKQQKMITIAMTVLAVLLAVNVIAIGIGYMTYPGYWDHGEPILTSASYMMLSGQELYPAFDAAQFTSNLYGPFLFSANALMMGIFGGNVAASKALGPVMVISLYILTWLTYRQFGTRWAAAALILTAAYSLNNLPYSIWNRPDPALTTLAMIAVFLVVRNANPTRWIWLCLVIGALGGAASGFKLYGFLYVAPVGIYIALLGAGWTGVIVMLSAGIAMVFLPFAFPVFDLASYVDWFGLMAGKEVSPKMVHRGLRYFVMTALPALMLLIFVLRCSPYPSRLAEIAYSVFTLLGIGACSYLATKPGAGFYYVMPFVPLVVHQFTLAVRRARTDDSFGDAFGGRAWRVPIILGSILVLVMSIPSVPKQKRFIKTFHWDQARAVTSDLNGLIAEYPDQTIQMGAGHSAKGYRYTMYKPLLIFAGHPYQVDFGIMMETSHLGIPLPQALVDNIASCHTDIWLTPKNEIPFDMLGFYGNKSVDLPFREAFSANYDKIKSTEFFDVWHCNHVAKSS